MSVREAAQRLNISESAVRMRLHRGTLHSEQDDNGRTLVLLPRDNTEHTTETTAEVVEALRDQVRLLDEQVQFLRARLENEASANAEQRRLLAAALERIPPQLQAPREAPQEAPESPVSASDASDKGEGRADDTSQPRRPWYQRWFGS